jgi:hypothetical protein
MKKLLSFGLMLTTALSALAQAKVQFKNDSQHYFVLGETHPLDAGLGGGGSSGSVGAIPASPLPSGYTLIAALYGGFSSDNLSLQGQSVLSGGGWAGPGLMTPQNLILSTMPANGVTSYWQVVVADYIGTNLSQTEALTHYFGSSPEFTLVMSGGTITYPSILPGGVWESTWAPGNVVINYIPEPTALALMGLGVGSLLISRRKSGPRKMKTAKN